MSTAATIAPAPSPQLAMRRPTLDGLPIVSLPPNCLIRHYWPGDESAWDRVIGTSFSGDYRFDRIMRPDAWCADWRVLFVWQKSAERGAGKWSAVGTASAWFRPSYGARTGYLHFVGVLPEATGKALGLQVSLACLHMMAREGRTSAVLQTDDFRLPAVRTYLKLGFAPMLVDENQRQRWRDVFAALGRPELNEQFADELTSAVGVKT